MSHALDIDVETGEAAMMYVGELPWHGLGQELDGPATAAEAIKAAHLDWNVNLRDLYARDSEGKEAKVLGNYATVRSDRWNSATCAGSVLGVVGNRYTPLQNVEAFSFFDAIVGKGEAIYHTAGALDGGRRVWILAKMPGCIEVVGEDIVDKYLLLFNSHDGSSTVQAMFTPVRVVCSNTLAIAMGSRTKATSIRHTSSVKKQVDEAAQLMGIVNKTYDKLGVTFAVLANKQVGSGERLKAYFDAIYPEPEEDASKRKEGIYQRRVSTMTNIFESDPKCNIKGIAGSYWAAYNAVTQYIDHDQPRNWDTADKRMGSIVLGSGADVKRRALDVAVASAG